MKKLIVLFGFISLFISNLIGQTPQTLKTEQDSVGFYYGYCLGIKMFRSGVRQISDDYFYQGLYAALNAKVADIRNVFYEKSVTETPANDSVGFWCGFMGGKDLLLKGVVDIDSVKIKEGVEGALNGMEMNITPLEMQQFIDTYMDKYLYVKGEENRTIGIRFLQENKKNPNVKELPNGVQYEIEKSADGKFPKLLDKVKVHYVGQHLNGKIFDQTTVEPSVFVLNQVIMGWTDVLMLMSPGAKWKVYIPSDRAYGFRGGNGIEPGETLIFEIELLEIL